MGSKSENDCREMLLSINVIKHCYFVESRTNIFNLSLLIANCLWNKNRLILWPG